MLPKLLKDKELKNKKSKKIITNNGKKINNVNDIKIKVKKINEKNDNYIENKNDKIIKINQNKCNYDNMNKNTFTLDLNQNLKIYIEIYSSESNNTNKISNIKENNNNITTLSKNKINSSKLENKAKNNNQTNPNIKKTTNKSVKTNQTNIVKTKNTMNYSNNIKINNKNNIKYNIKDINNKEKEEINPLLKENINSTNITKSHNTKICESIKKKKHKKIKCDCPFHRDFRLKISKFDKKKTKKRNVSNFSIFPTKVKKDLIIEKKYRTQISHKEKKVEINIEQGYREQFYSIKNKNLDFEIQKFSQEILNEKNNESFLTESTAEDLSFSILPDYTIKLPETPKGLKNFALNCYMNSLLQCLYHIKGLRTSFIDPTKFSPKTQKVCYYLSEVMKGLTYGKDKYYSANNFKKVLGDINSLFKGTKGADVTDLYRTIVDSIISEIPYECPEDEEDDDGDNTNQEKYYTIAKKEVDENNPIIKELNYFFETIYYCPEGYQCYSIQNDTSIMFELL